MTYNDIIDIRDFKLFFRNNVMNQIEADNLIANHFSNILQIKDYHWSDSYKTLSIHVTKDDTKSLDHYLKDIYPTLDCFLRGIYSKALFFNGNSPTDSKQSRLLSKMLSGDLPSVLISEVKYFNTENDTVFMFCF